MSGSPADLADVLRSAAKGEFPAADGGWDRICALLSGAESIRDVIAFPKSGGGYDPLTGAPAPITPQQRKEAGVDSKPVPPTA